ncbi:MAG: barstar family protein [Betaproteobacteria bacterium]|nr:barstar family protein [Betaproteobacteria bacterium]
MTPAHRTALLREPGRAGVYHLPSTGADDMLAAAEAMGLAVLRVDLTGVRTKAALMDAMGRDLDLPAWFGRNWDALEDCLTDLSWRPADGWVIVLEHVDQLATARVKDLRTALEICNAAANFWRGENIPLWTLVDLHADGLAWLPELP